MTVKQLFDFIKGVRPGFAFTDAQLTVWLNEIEGHVQTDIWLLEPAVDETQTGLVEYDSTIDTETGEMVDANHELLVPFPWNKLYRYFLLMSIDLANGEYQRYANSYELFNEAYEEYAGWYAQHVSPANGEAITRGYYISAYQFAARGGYAGTEEDFYETLGGIGTIEQRAEEAVEHAEAAAVEEINGRLLNDTASTAYGRTVTIKDGAEGRPVTVTSIVAEPQAAGVPTPESPLAVRGFDKIKLTVAGASITDSPTTHTIQLPETVYAGVLDIAAGTFTVTHGYVELDETAGWNFTDASIVRDTGTIPHYRFSIRFDSYLTNNGLPPTVAPNARGYASTGWCDRYMRTCGDVYRGDLFIYASTTYSNYNWLKIEDNRFSNLNAFLDSVKSSEGKQLKIVYRLAAPRTLNLSSSALDVLNDICTREGNNTFSVESADADTSPSGTFTLSYYKDPLLKEQVISSLTVTPEMYGAVGDGHHDDTAAMNAAMNSGYNVYLSSKKRYLLTDTVTIPKMAWRGRTIYSDAKNGTRQTAQIYCKFINTARPVFLIESDGVNFDKVNINALNYYGAKNMNYYAYTAEGALELTVFRVRAKDGSGDDVVDCDFAFESGSIKFANTVMDCRGRGIKFANNDMADNNRLLDVSWMPEGGGAYHDDATGMRAYIIENNRFHSIPSTLSFIHIRSGNVMAFRFCNNEFDRGYSRLLTTNAGITAEGWMFSGNTIVGMDGPQMINIDGNANQLTFTNNYMKNGVESGYNYKDAIKITGNLTNSLIANNTLDKIIQNGHLVSIDGDIDNCTFSSNVVSTVKDLTANSGIVESKGDMTSTSFTGNTTGALDNATGDVAYRALVHDNSDQDTKTITNVRMFGNVAQANGNESVIPCYTFIDTPTAANLLCDSDLFSH